MRAAVPRRLPLSFLDAAAALEVRAADPALPVTIGPQHNEREQYEGAPENGQGQAVGLDASE